MPAARPASNVVGSTIAPAASVGPSMPSVPMLAAATSRPERARATAPSQARTPDCVRPCRARPPSPSSHRTKSRRAGEAATRARCDRARDVRARGDRAPRRSPARRPRARDSRAPRRRVARRRSRRAAGRSPAPSARASRGSPLVGRLRHVAGGAALETCDDGSGIAAHAATPRQHVERRQQTCCRRRRSAPTRSPTGRRRRRRTPPASAPSRATRPPAGRP